MFTGLVRLLAIVDEMHDAPPGKRVVVAAGALAQQAAVGDSIAINGCCLTVVAVAGERLSFEAGAETLLRTNLGALTPGSQVNLEPSLRVGEAMGGHFVTGHVDGRGRLVSRHDDQDWSNCWFSAEARLMKQMAPQGSIAIDGVSLTLVEVATDRFRVALIPHTLAVTTLGRLRVGDVVNLETDVLAKYVEQQIRSR